MDREDRWITGIAAVSCAFIVALVIWAIQAANERTEWCLGQGGHEIDQYKSETLCVDREGRIIE